MPDVAMRYPRVASAKPLVISVEREDRHCIVKRANLLLQADGRGCGLLDQRGVVLRRLVDAYDGVLIIKKYIR